MKIHGTRKKENILVPPIKSSNLDRFKNLSVNIPKQTEFISPIKINQKQPEAKLEIPIIKISSFNSNSNNNTNKKELSYFNNLNNMNNNSININPTYNNSNNYIFNSPIIKFDDDQDNEKSADKEILGSSDNKTLKISKIHNKDKKHNLLKIVNMYMKDDKKVQSKLKLSGIFTKGKNNKKKNLYLLAAENTEHHRNKSSNLKLPIIDDEDLNYSRSNKSFATNHLGSGNSSNSKNDKFIKLFKRKKNPKDQLFTYSEYDNNSTQKNLRIPKIKSKLRKQIDISNSNNKNDTLSTESNIKKRKSNNIINIVNNLNRNNDKNNNIGLKVNINQYDIMYYIPNKNKNNKENLNTNKNKDILNSDMIHSDNDSSKSSADLISENDMGYEKSKGEKNNENGIKVDIINISKRNKKEKIKSNRLSKEESEIEKRIRRHILHKIKSLNNLYKTDIYHNRPMLNKLTDSNDNSNNSLNRNTKMKFKKFLSKEIEPNVNNHENTFDLEGEFKEDLDSSNIPSDKKNKSEVNNLVNNDNLTINESNNLSISILTKKKSNNTSVEKFQINLINNTKNNNTQSDISERTKNKTQESKRLNQDSDKENKNDNEDEKDSNSDLISSIGKKKSINLSKNRKNKDLDNSLQKGGEVEEELGSVSYRKISELLNNGEIEDALKKEKKNEDKIFLKIDVEEKNSHLKSNSKNKTEDDLGDDYSSSDLINDSENNDNSKIGKKRKKSRGNKTTSQKKKQRFMNYLFDKINQGEKLQSGEESFYNVYKIVNQIVEDSLRIFLEKNKNLSELDCQNEENIENNKKNQSEIVADNSTIKTEQNNKKTEKIDESVNDNENKLNKTHISENSIENKIDLSKKDDGILKTSSNNSEKDGLFQNKQNDGWIYKYEDKFFEKISDPKYKSPHEKRKKKPTRNQSLKNIRNLSFDYINPADIKDGLMLNKRLIKSHTLNPIRYCEIDEELIKRNIKLMNLNSSESEEEQPIDKIKTKNIVKRVFLLKNFNTLRKTKNKIRDNWQMIFDNPNLDENTKLRFMDIQSNKTHLKNKIEVSILERIEKIIEDDLNFDKNNKLSNKLNKLYREENYELETLNYDESKNIIPNPTFLGAKARILQENKDYLISAYFDIYQEILNDIFNSGNSIFEFNENMKGRSILKNFQIRNKERQPLHKSPLKDVLLNRIESLKGSFNHKKNLIPSHENSLISEKIKYIQMTSKDNNCNSNNFDNDDTRSNYDRLGLANQTYINNILLRDFSYKEKLQYCDKSKSDSLSDNTADNTSQINDSASLNTPRTKLRNSTLIKNNSTLFKIFKDPIKKAANKFLNSRSPVTNNDNDNDETKIIKKKNSSDGFNDNENNNFDNNTSIKDTVKKKKKRDKKNKFLKMNGKEKNDNSSFFDLLKKETNDPMYILKNVFNNKEDISLLRNQSQLNKLLRIKNFSNLKSNNENMIRSPINCKIKSTENDKSHIIEKKKLMSSTPLTKENTLFKTLEIKSSLLKSLKDDPSEILRFYIKDGNFVKFKELFEKNKNLIDCIDENWDSLLNIAVKCNHYEIASYILDHGADVNLQNKNKNAPLHYALSFKNFKMANLLIMKKADEELTNGKGFTPWQLLTLNENVDDM